MGLVFYAMLFPLKKKKQESGEIEVKLFCTIKKYMHVVRMWRFCNNLHQVRSKSNI